MTAIWERLERKSLDELTGLSRQRRWQLRQQAAGKCQICGKPRGKKGNKAKCRKCADANHSKAKVAA